MTFTKLTSPNHLFCNFVFPFERNPTIQIMWMTLGKCSLKKEIYIYMSYIKEIYTYIRHTQREREHVCFSPGSTKTRFHSKQMRINKKECPIHPLSFPSSEYYPTDSRFLKNGDTLIFLTPQELPSHKLVVEYQLLHLDCEQMKLSSLPLQLEQTHASVLNWHTPS